MNNIKLVNAIKKSAATILKSQKKYNDSVRQQLRIIGIACNMSSPELFLNTGEDKTHELETSVGTSDIQDVIESLSLCVFDQLKWMEKCRFNENQAELEKLIRSELKVQIDIHPIAFAEDQEPL